MSKTDQIVAACRAYTDMGDAARIVRSMRYLTADEIEAIAAAKDNLETLLSDTGFTRSYTDAGGRRMESGTAYSGRLGHVAITESGAHVGVGAKFTPRATVAGSARRAAIKARVASDERSY